MWLSSLAFIGLLIWHSSAAKLAALPAPAITAAAGTRAAGTLNGGASDPRSDGRPGCRFERPAVWKAGRVSWLGSCQKGFAHGSGVILNVVEGQEPDRFYGRVQNGYLSVGVLQTSGGYMAGSWVHGTLADALADDVAQRNVVIAAFRNAANAATAVSKSFAKKSDTKSSRFYAKQARLLRDQMD